MRKAPLYLSLLVSVIWMLVIGGCGGGSENNGTGAGSGTAGSGGAPSGAGGSGGDCTFNCGTTTTTSTSNTQGVIILSPPDPTLTVDNGSIPSQPFTAMLNGNDVTGQVTWSFERPDIGDVIAGSTFTPSGNVAGFGKLTARLNMSEGSTTVTVFIKKLVNTAGITPAEQSAFDTPVGPDPSVSSILYPYNETVFPLDVLAPEVQWNGGQAGDVYRLKITEKYYEYTEFFAAPPPSRHLVAEADWKSIAESGTGSQSDPVGVALSRSSGGAVYEPVQQTWHVARGRLKGSVYYWELPDACGSGNANGRILRIKPDSPTVDEFFTPGGCWGCHTVSRDGKKMAAEFNDGNGPMYTLNLDMDPVTYGDITPGNPAGNFVFSAFNNTGDKLLVSENNTKQLRVVDSVTGDTLNPNALGDGCGEPAWSPDGTKVSAICGMTNGFWTFDATTGNLVVGDVQPDGTTVANVNTIVPQAGGVGRPAYPSFSPGSEWLAFGRPTTGSRSTGNGTLWMVRPDGQELKQLTIAGSDNRSFNPVFAPLRAGGHFWLVFVSRRDYGNTLVNANRQQLWITAIDDPPTGAADPSHPPFYLRGQENCAKSENAYYALDPCKEIGEGCLSGIDCCNGQCIKDQSTGLYVCGEPPPPGVCSENGNSCATTSDCCDPSASCVDGFCAPPVPR